MPTSRPFPVRVVSVQDGDSLVVRPAQSGRDEQFRLRLYAIDAPEGDQRYGHEARDYLRRLVWNRTDLMLESMDTDQYGRLVGVLYYRGTDRRRSINRLMVQQGLARWYSRYGGHGLGLEQAERTPGAGGAECGPPATPSRRGSAEGRSAGRRNRRAASSGCFWGCLWER